MIALRGADKMIVSPLQIAASLMSWQNLSSCIRVCLENYILWKRGTPDDDGR